MSALTLPPVSDLLSQARQLEELLDAYGARNNRKWSRFRSLTATIKLFAEVVYELLHIYRALNFYRLLPIEHDFKSATRQAIERTHEVLQTASNLILAEATRLGLTPPADEHWSRLYAESVPAVCLPHDRPARKIKHVAETVIYRTGLLNAASEGEILTLPRAEESENYAAPRFLIRSARIIFATSRYASTVFSRSMIRMSWGLKPSAPIQNFRCCAAISASFSICWKSDLFNPLL